jgi:hypothetical protein
LQNGVGLDRRRFLLRVPAAAARANKVIRDSRRLSPHRRADGRRPLSGAMLELSGHRGEGH